jgi:protocatechuate 3,4-dioxygenase, beta subunit
MSHIRPWYSRRGFLGSVGFAAAAWYVPGAFAAALTPTPVQTEGPFYPDKLPLDTDNDLLIVNDAITPAVGTVTHLTGRILGASGNPIRGAIVEIWQCDNHGAYLHSGTSNRDKRDSNFQGFGRFLTGSTGEYYFRTIKPVAYPGRTPHIHYAVKVPRQPKFTTQCYIKGEPQNDKDFVLAAVKDAAARQSLIVDFAPIKDSRIGEVAARFDIVLGITPQS